MEENKNKRIAKNTTFLYLRSLLILFVTLYTSRILLDALGKSDYGLYFVVAGFVSMFTFLNASMVSAIQRFLNNAIGKNDNTKYNSIFGNALSIQCAIALIVLVFTETFGIWFIKYKMSIPVGKETAAMIVFQFSILSFLFKIFQAPLSAVIVSNERMNFYAIQGILESLLLLAISFIVRAFENEKLTLYSSLTALTSFSVLLLNFTYVKFGFRKLPFRFTWNKTQIKELASFMGWSVFGAFSTIMKTQGINLILNIFFNVIVNAARGIAMQVLGGVHALIANFQTAFKPQLIQSYAEGNMKRYFSLTYYGSKISFYIMWFLSLPILLSINHILTIWLGAENVPEYTGSFTIVVLLTGLVETFASPIAMAVNAIGKIRDFQIWISIIKLLIIPFAIISCQLGAPPIATMIVSFVFEIIAHTVRIIIWRSLCSFSVKNYFLTVIVPCVMVAIVSYGVCFFLLESLNVSDSLNIIIASLVTTFVNVLLIYSIGLNKKERSTILKTIKKIYK